MIISDRISTTLAKGYDMQVIRLEPHFQGWQMLISHLKNSGDARWVVNDAGQPLEPSLVFLAAKLDQQIVGSLTLKKQPLIIPPSEWAGKRDRSLRDADGDLVYELFVQTFRVEEGYRRRGIGRTLQAAGLKTAKQQACYQVRSWSSLDKKENFLLKLSMGFGFHPEIQHTASGFKVSGGYFVKVV